MKDTEDFTPEQREIAEKHDLPLVKIVVDRRHCTGANKGKSLAAGPAPEDLASHLEDLADKFDERFREDPA